jgi:acetamidase/formamidase
MQGDGVVDQTAIETAAENLEIRYDLHKQVALRGPLGETDTAWIVVAFAAGLDDALVACLREVIYWLLAASGRTGPEAYALASMAVSFRVTQYANQAGSAYTSIPPRAVHAVIPKSVFPAGLRDRISAWLRP